MIAFELSDTQVQAIKEWIEQHSKDHVMTYTGAIGGRWSYTFTPTSIGDVVTIKCACGAKQDVSEL